MGAILDLIIWTVGGFICFGIVAVIHKGLERIIGGFAIIVSFILFCTMLMLLTGVVDIPLGPERGPAFFTDSN